jgi:hypothetical protein
MTYPSALGYLVNGYVNFIVGNVVSHADVPKWKRGPETRKIKLANVNKSKSMC